MGCFSSNCMIRCTILYKVYRLQSKWYVKFCFYQKSLKRVNDMSNMNKILHKIRHTVVIKLIEYRQRSQQIRQIKGRERKVCNTKCVKVMHHIIRLSQLLLLSISLSQSNVLSGRISFLNAAVNDSW